MSATMCAARFEALHMFQACALNSVGGQRKGSVQHITLSSNLVHTCTHVANIFVTYLIVKYN